MFILRTGLLSLCVETVHKQAREMSSSNNIVACSFPVYTLRNYNAMIPQNDGATSFWPNYDVHVSTGSVLMLTILFIAWVSFAVASTCSYLWLMNGEYFQFILSTWLCDISSCNFHLHWFNALSPRRNGQHFANDIFRRILFNENVWISIKISLKFVPVVPINNIPAYGSGNGLAPS